MAASTPNICPNCVSFAIPLRGVLLLLALALLPACDKKKDDEQQVSDFDRAAMLTHTADKLIVPTYQSLTDKAQALKDTVTNLVANPTAQRLANARTAWYALALARQQAGPYNFGPASLATGTLDQEIATFPVDTTQVEAYIGLQDYTLNNFDRDTRGLYTIEYLLYRFTEADYGSNNARSQYLIAVATHLHSKAAGVLNAWVGGYRSTFVGNTGTDAGSSVSLLFNNMVMDYEMLKNYKFGIPCGLRVGQTTEAPTAVEAYFSGRSTELARAHLQASEDLWRGKAADGTDGPGFEDYLLATTGGQGLVAEANLQWLACHAALNALPTTPLQDQIVAQSALPDNAFTELQKLTRFLKSETSSLLGISITYSSSDGD